MATGNFRARVQLRGDLEVLRRDLKNLRSVAMEAVDVAFARESRRIQKDDLVGAIRGGQAPPPALAPATIETRLQGKRRGIWPPRARYAARPALLRSGDLARAIVLARDRISGRLIYEIAVDHERGTTRDRHAARRIAETMHALETGTVVVVPVSVAMLAYLNALMRGTAGPPSEGEAKAGPSQPLAKVVVTVIPPRPIFRRAWQRARDRFPTAVGSVVHHELQRRLGRGAKVV